MSEHEPSPVIAVAHAKARADEPFTLSTGIRAKIVSVASGLMEEAANGVSSPKVPIFIDENGREQENPNHPDYVAALADYEHKRNQAVLDAVIMFGIELVDPIPEDDKWLKKLKYLAKRGALNLDAYDLKDELELEFVYKRYIAVGNEDIEQIVGMTTLTEEARKKAEAGFQRS